MSTTTADKVHENVDSTTWNPRRNIGGNDEARLDVGGRNGEEALP
jgi:hypothetical protein